ncbi:DNA polymerase, partial [Henriciella sp.]|uniref:DNA polymerase n=1 Tax=Henriciella sp. TaxID=1968823 RepID=UPI0018381A7C
EHGPWILLAADYSQVELRVMAHLAQDPEMIAAFERGDVDGSSIWRTSELIAPLEEACRDNAFLMEFYTWEISAYWHAIGGHSLAETIRVGLETLRGEVAGAEPDKAAP